MNNNKYNEYVIFLICLIIFIAAAYWGYEKLHYGFNFIDEGYHMSEGWRVAEGDHLLDNKSGALVAYRLINSLIFKAKPDITLLDFRKIQYLLTLCALLIFGICMYAVTKTHWHLPFVFSVFAFTGLDPTGMIANMNYYTYPHLFLILFLSFFVTGLYSQKPWVKYACFIFSGIFLWAISFSLLYLSAVVIAPILLYVACRILPIRSFSFTFKELIIVLLPVAAGWLLFIGLFAQSFIPATLDAVSASLSITSHSKGSLLNSMAGTGAYIGINAIIILTFYFLSKRFNNYLIFILLCGISILFYFIIESSFFGIVQPYYNGWFGRPMWFSGFIIAFILLFWAHIIQRAIRRKAFTWTEELIVILLLPVTIKSVCTIFLSGQNALTVLHSAIPAVAAFAIMLIHNTGVKKRSVWLKFAVIIFALTPFYLTTARADWRFTFFDVIPEQARTEIKQGYGKGIKTNPVYAQLYKWIEKTSAKYSNDNDFMISYIVSPMTHMITKRRPALDDTFIDLSSRRSDVYKKSIDSMKQNKRNPAIAFVFQRMPALFPVSLEQGSVTWPGKQFQLKWSNDPISNYIKNHMMRVEQFYISKQGDHVVQCYVDPKLGNLKLPKR